MLWVSGLSRIRTYSTRFLLFPLYRGWGCNPLIQSLVNCQLFYEATKFSSFTSSLYFVHLFHLRFSVESKRARDGIWTRAGGITIRRAYHYTTPAIQFFSFFPVFLVGFRHTFFCIFLAGDERGGIRTPDIFVRSEAHCPGYATRPWWLLIYGCE